MIKLPFRKMHGAGNDFIMLTETDLDRLAIRVDRRLIAKLCHRQLGIGADGLIVITKGTDTDFGMLYYNADGGEAGMCGNGARCAFDYARELGLVADAGRFSTGAGVIAGDIVEGEVRVGLTPPRDLRTDLDFGFETPFDAIHLIDTGVPHLVIPVENLETIDLPQWGPRLRGAAELKPDGANVNWVQPHARNDSWLIRTYERGVEAETLACGTGASASAAILVHLGLADAPVCLLTRGGYRLNIDVERIGNADYALKLRGPATTVFEGEVALDE